jgi:PAS domain S-box-containing protein
MTPIKKLPRIKINILWRPVLFFLLFFTVIILFGRFYYRSQKLKIVEEQQRDLSAIATLKIGQIEQWRKERLGNAATIRDNEPLIRSINDFLSHSVESNLRADIQKWMNSVCSEGHYSGITLVDTNNQVRMTSLSPGSVCANFLPVQITDVIRHKKTILTDLLKSESSGCVYMQLLLPLIKLADNTETVFGVMILQIDPHEDLYPIVETWPAQSRSSETLLLKKDGDSLLFLNKLRFGSHNLLNFRLPTGDPSLLATKAVNGFEGVTQGVDYRNIPVVGYIARVPGFPWFMVAKTDKAELDAPLKVYFHISVLISILLLIINISLFGLWIRNLKLRMYRIELKNETDSKLMKEAIRKNEERFTSTLDHMIEGCQIIGHDWRYLYLNDAADVHNRCPKEQLLGKTYMESWPGIENTEVFHVLNDCMVQRTHQHLENKFIYPDGSAGWFELIIQPVPEGVFILSIDITIRKLAEEALQANEERYHKIFNSLIEGFCVVEMVFNDVQKPVDYRFIEVNESFESQTGLKNAKGKFIRELAPSNEEYWFEIYGNVALTGDSIHFENEAKALNRWFEVRASRVEDHQNKHVAIYFNDITERKSGEHALRNSEERFRSLYENITIGIYRTSHNGEILMANPAMVRMLGFDSFEQLAQRNLELEGYQPGYPRSKFIETMESEGRITGLESVWKKKNGDPVFVRENASAIRDAKGDILYFDGTVEDISERKKMEEALRESEDKFKYIFDHSMLGKSITLASGELQVNEAFCKILGYSSEEISKLKWQDFTHPDDFEITESVIRAHMNGETNFSRFIKRYIRKDGAIIWTDVSTSLRYDKEGKPLYFMTTINDITELKLAEEVLRNEEKRLRDLLEALPQLFWTCKPEGPCDYLSRQWLDYTGIEESRQLGYGWLDQLHPDDRQRAISAWNEKVISGESFDMEFRIRRSDGIYHWFQTRALPIRNADNRIIRWLGSNTDIDSIRKAELQIKNYNRDLERRVIQRTEQLAVANQELEAFSYSVSHDLRAPLRSVHGYTRILLEEYNNVLDDEGKRICGIITKSATQMGELIDDLLSFSRIGRSNLNPLLLDMRDIVSSVTNDLTGQSDKNRINITIKKLYNAYGDSNLIRQVWINLISNAIKYSSKKEKSEILIKSTKEDDKIIYMIRDNGVGFDMKFIHKLFGVFQRLHSSSEFEGNGVGLAIVQRIILKHGGNVWAEAEEGNGAIFYFSLPAENTVNI